jgi:predicted aminopeptidase
MVKAARWLVLALAIALATGCAIPYYWQAVGGQIELLRKRTPIEKLVEDPKIDASLKDTLRRVIEMRRFAVEELALPDNDSYTTYVALDRSYVVWNVVAAREFSVEPERWCFPFAGCVAYRGYFDRADAERFAAKLAAEGLDTHSGGSSAYSTLGYFDDPLLSTMVGGGEQYIAGVLFHELAHQKLYIKDDSELSEAFASVVEEYGAERWLTSHAPPEDLARYRARRVRREEFGSLIAAQQERLRGIYAQAAPEEMLRAEKRQAFEQLQSDYRALKARWGGVGDYDGWFAQPQNNASLASVATYTRWVPALRERLAAVGLEQFYTDTAELAALDAAAREARLSSWADGADVGAVAAR